MSTIEKGSTVLVTGVNGLVASHVANQLLADGYKVRGTVRSLSKADWLYELFDEKYGKGSFEAVEVADMVREGAFDEAVKGVSGICHLASITLFSANPNEVIPPTVKGALNILTSASKEASVKSLVYTSSSAAALVPQPNKEFNVTKDTWNDAAVQSAWKDESPNAYTVYAASKTEAERAVWKAVKEVQPPFQVAAILPNANFGAVLNPQGPTSTVLWLTGVFNGEKLFNLPPQYFISLSDDAKLHVAALTDPAANGQRLFGFAAPYNENDLLAIFRKVYPAKNFLPDDPDIGRDLSKIPNGDAEALLRKHYGHGFMGLEETIKETVQGWSS